MIIRQVRCTLAERDLPAFLEHARRVVADHVGKVDGLLLLELGLKDQGGAEVAVMAQSHWRDSAAMQSYLKEYLYRPAMWDPEEKWLISATVEHFEVVARQASAGHEADTAT